MTSTTQIDTEQVLGHIEDAEDALDKRRDQDLPAARYAIERSLRLAKDNLQDGHPDDAAHILERVHKNVTKLGPVGRHIRLARLQLGGIQ